MAVVEELLLAAVEDQAVQGVIQVLTVIVLKE
jgi:hypothetical protein